MKKHEIYPLDNAKTHKNDRYQGMCMVYLGSLTKPVNLVPTANIYCDSQLSWVPGIAGIRTFAQGIAKQAKPLEKPV